MNKLTRRTLLAGVSAGTLTPVAAKAFLFRGGGTSGTVTQTITAVTPSSGSVASGSGTNTVISAVGVTMSPSSPNFSGTLALTGADAGDFNLSSSTLPSNLRTTGSLLDGTYNLNIVATQGGATGSPFTQPVTVTVGTVVMGFYATVQLGSPPAGTIYTFNPDSPGVNQTATNEGDFVSDFASFTQASIHCKRTDIDLRIYFRKDTAGALAGRVECIMEMGHPTIGGGAANLGDFTLKVFDSGNTLKLTQAFPQIGWFSRWRCGAASGGSWQNPPPLRPEARTRAQLLPAGDNLVPNFSSTLATDFGCVNCQTGNTLCFPISTYSSAYYSGQGNNLNPSGINENCGLATSLGGVGGRPELGVVTEWQANYIINGNSGAQTAMYVCAEVAGGMPWIVRDLTTTAPVDLFVNANVIFGAPGYDTPSVSVPSGAGTWNMADVNHTPPISYVAYILTGDPFYLENLQFQANWLVGKNTAHHGSPGSSFIVNLCDINNFAFAPSDTFQVFPSWLSQCRGLGWALRDYAAAYIATPASVPGWLLPKSYFSQALDDNATFADDWGTNYDSLNPSHTYPNLTALGHLPVSWDFEEGFFLAFLLLGLGMVINQAGKTNWLNYANFVSKVPVGLSNGTSGWDKRMPSPYVFPVQACSTDYDLTPAAITNHTDMWNFFINTAYASAPAPWASSAGFFSSFGSRLPSTAYACNSWIFECRTGIPTPPVAGDIVSCTITGSFSGSPVTVSHTVTSGDVTAISAYSTGNQGDGTSQPIIDALISSINGNGTLIAAGITASLTATAGAGVTFASRATGRMYLNFNGATTTIVVTGSFTTSTPGTIYVQPNGDGMHDGANSGGGMFGRPASYCCAKNGTSGSGSGPNGAGFTFGTLTADGTTLWGACPEVKSWPCFCPGIGTQGAFPRMMNLSGVGNGSPQYSFQMWSGMTTMQSAGITGASGCVTNLRAIVDDYKANVDPTFQNQFNFSIAP